VNWFLLYFLGRFQTTHSNFCGIRVIAIRFICCAVKWLGVSGLWGY
jgi:hypothetical protein